MTDLWLIAYVVLPLIIVALGYAATRLDRGRHHQVGE